MPAQNSERGTLHLEGKAPGRVGGERKIQSLQRPPLYHYGDGGCHRDGSSDRIILWREPRPCCPKRNSGEFWNVMDRKVLDPKAGVTKRDAHSRGSAQSLVPTFRGTRYTDNLAPSLRLMSQYGSYSLSVNSSILV